MRLLSTRLLKDFFSTIHFTDVTHPVAGVKFTYFCYIFVFTALPLLLSMLLLAKYNHSLLFDVNLFS